ncbi:MAG: FdtA/QdtA family cupin domain-containing protein [Sandaracinaceae bacterium]
MAEPATLLPPPPSSPVRLVTARPRGSIPPAFGTPTAVERVSLVELAKISDKRGDLVVAELDRHVPFLVERMYALLNVPEGEERGGHAHKELEQLLVVLSGSLELTVDDGESRQRYALDSNTWGIYIRPMVWRELHAFAPNTVCVVLASAVYDESDYLRDYDAFKDELAARGLGPTAKPSHIRAVRSTYPAAAR